MSLVGERIGDGRVLGLIGSYLKQGIMKGLEQWTPVNGTPQGAVISPLLANVYLHPLDSRMKAKGYRMVRYADDFVILCPDEQTARDALAEVEAWVKENGLRLNMDKTHVGDCTKEGEGFEFLGYRFEAGKRWVRRKSLNALRERIRSKTKRNCGKSIRQVIQMLNPTLAGWFNYFKHAHRYVFHHVDGLVRRRLRAILRRHQHRPGFGKCLSDHIR